MKEAKLFFDKMNEVGVSRIWLHEMGCSFHQSGRCLEVVLMLRKLHLYGFNPDGTGTVSSVVY